MSYHNLDIELPLEDPHTLADLDDIREALNVLEEYRNTLNRESTAVANALTKYKRAAKEKLSEMAEKFDMIVMDGR